MASFKVTWEIDIEAETTLEAACLALTIQRDPDSTATVFTVISEDGSEVGIFDIDYINTCLEGDKVL